MRSLPFGLAMLVALLPVAARAQAFGVVRSDVAAFVAPFAAGPVDQPVIVGSYAELGAAFGASSPASDSELQVKAFFDNGGTTAVIVRSAGAALADLLGSEPDATGVHALANGPRFGLLVLPTLRDLSEADQQAALAALAPWLARERAFGVLDPPRGLAAGNVVELVARNAGFGSAHAAMYFPDLDVGGRVIGPSGSVAGVIARLDAARGVWTQPAGRDALLRNAQPVVALSAAQEALLASAGINSLRTFPGVGAVVWGSRTLRAPLSSEPGEKYVSVRRLTDMIQASLEAGTAWAAASDNDAVLWQRLAVDAELFLHALWRAGALRGSRASEAFFVRCDASTTTAADIARHRAILLYGFAPLKPAEFSVHRVVVPTR